MKIQRAQFLATRSPRRGTANPEQHDEPPWLHQRLPRATKTNRTQKAAKAMKP